MPVFHFQEKSINYEVHRGLVPEDVLLIHGNLASNQWWQPTIAELKKRSVSKSWAGLLIAAEWVGCGKSSGPRNEADLEIQNLAQDFLSLLSGTGLSDVNVVGHSTGGLIALQAMALKPEIFSKAVLLDPVGASGVQLSPEILQAFSKMRSDRAYCELVMSGTIHGVDVKSAFFQKLVDDAFGVNPLIWEGIPKALSQTDIRMAIKKLRQDILVLHGEHDAVLPLQDSKELAKLLPNGKFELLEGQGHSCNVEDPELFVDKTLKFLFP